MKTFTRSLTSIALAALGLAVPSARAQWNQNAGVGPYTYTDPANWVGGLVNNFFTNPAPATGITLQFTNDLVLTNGLIMGFTNNGNLTFQSDSATPRTLHISLGSILRTNQSGGVITIGTTNNPLILDLYNSTRTIGGVGSGNQSFGDATMNVYAKITDLAGGTNGVNLGVGRVYTFLLNNSNDFVGPVSFAGLRGGGFTSIKNIGAGPSAMGAPTDVTNGTVSVVDNTSFGHVDYLGSGDTTDRPFIWNLTASQYLFENVGSGKITFTGPWLMPYAALRTNFFTVAAFSNHVELAGWIYQTNNTLTNLVFKAGPNTNRVILTGTSNNFAGCELTNVVLAFNNIAAANVPCALGTNAAVVHRGNAVASGSANASGHGADLQYFGPTTTFPRSLWLAGTGYNWGIENAGTNTTLTFTTDFVAASTGGGATARNIWLDVNALTATTNFATMEIQGAIPDVGPGIITSVQVAAPTGYTINNGGLVRLTNPTNSFSGALQVRYARTAQALTLADSGTACSIGMAGGTYPVGLTAINIGSTDSQRGGTLTYIGTTDASCNRQISILGSVGGASGGTFNNNSPNNSKVHYSDTGSLTFNSTMSNCVVILGGTAVATNIFDPSIPQTTLGNASLLVNGSAWQLTASHFYGGTTIVTNGTLLVEGTINSTSDTMVQRNGVLGGNGTLNNNLIVLTNGTVAPGDSIGTLTVVGNLTNSGTLRMEVKASDGTHDLITGVSTLVYGGTLAVSNLGGTYTNGASFQLFSATAYQGSFAAISPATPGTGLAWDTSTLATDGKLRITVGASTPPTIGGISASSGSVVLTGTNNTGTGGGTFYVRSTTNISVPLVNWKFVSTNVFGGSGGFSVTNAMTPGATSEYYLLQLP